MPYAERRTDSIGLKVYSTVYLGVVQVSELDLRLCFKQIVGILTLGQGINALTSLDVYANIIKEGFVMKLKKRIAAMGAAVMMAVSMMSVNASAANTNTTNSQALSYVNAKANDYLIVRFFPKKAVKLIGPDESNLVALVQSDSRSYQKSYKYASLKPYASVLVKKNSGDGQITIKANYCHNGTPIGKTVVATVDVINNKKKDVWYTITNNNFSQKFEISKNKNVSVAFQLETDSDLIAKKSNVDLVQCEVKYRN